MKEYLFNNMEEIDSYLLKDEYDMPLRSEGRKSFHTEYYTLKYFLLETKSELFCDFPVKLHHKDKPDFRIFRNNNSIGIEVTESIPEQLARAASLLEKMGPEYILLESDFFGWDAPDRNNAEIIAIIEKSNKKLIGNGYVGNSIEINWANGLISCINNKTIKLNKPNYDKYDNNWLLVYDNQVRIIIDNDFVVKYLKDSLKSYRASGSVYFNRIIIIAGGYIYSITFDEEPIIVIIKRNAS